MEFDATLCVCVCVCVCVYIVDKDLLYVFST